MAKRTIDLVRYLMRKGLTRGEAERMLRDTGASKPPTESEGPPESDNAGTTESTQDPGE